MTNEEINLAIAKWCGCRAYPESGIQQYGTGPNRSPDYCNDLNAIHLVEKEIIKDENLSDQYDMSLIQITGAVDDETGLPMFMSLWHATARQRCEALLRTIGKWKEALK